jgi:hypothetical protein
MLTPEQKQPYFKLSTNEYGKHWLFYKPLKTEPGRYGCWMPIDDEFYSEFAELQAKDERIKELEELVEFGGGDWISVKERMPEPDVLVSTSKQYGSGNRDYGVSFTTKRFPDIFDDFLGDRITHWRALPKNPDEYESLKTKSNKQ